MQCNLWAITEFLFMCFYTQLQCISIHLRWNFSRWHIQLETEALFIIVELSKVKRSTHKQELNEKLSNSFPEYPWDTTVPLSYERRSDTFMSMFYTLYIYVYNPVLFLLYCFHFSCNGSQLVLYISFEILVLWPAIHSCCESSVLPRSKDVLEESHPETRETS